MEANPNFVYSRFEKEFIKLPDSNLERIIKQNSDTIKREEKTSLLGYGTLSGFIATSPLITKPLEWIGLDKVSNFVSDEYYFVAYFLIGTALTTASFIYNITGKRKEEASKFHTALNILNKRKEAHDLGKKYLKPDFTLSQPPIQ